MKKVIIILSSLLLVTGIAFAEDIRLNCDSNRIVLSGDSNLALLVFTDGSRSGTYFQNGKVYSIVFPRLKNSWEVHLNVSKETGQYSWEHGIKPFGKNNKQNVFRSGQCIKYKPFID